jgi:hypothetical protein
MCTAAAAAAAAVCTAAQGAAAATMSAASKAVVSMAALKVATVAAATMMAAAAAAATVAGPPAASTAAAITAGAGCNDYPRHEARPAHAGELISSPPPSQRRAFIKEAELLAESKLSDERRKRQTADAHDKRQREREKELARLRAGREFDEDVEHANRRVKGKW